MCLQTLGKVPKKDNTLPEPKDFGFRRTFRHASMARCSRALMAARTFGHEKRTVR